MTVAELIAELQKLEDHDADIEFIDSDGWSHDINDVHQSSNLNGEVELHE